MREKVICTILTFFTTADAIAFEQYAKETKLSGRLIPIPRELSAGCGMAYRIEKSKLPENFFTLIEEADIATQQIVEMLH